MANVVEASTTLGDRLSPEQLASFHKNGFLHFKGFLDRTGVDGLLKAMKELEQRWVTDAVEKVNGTPIKYGQDVDGRTIVQRFAFASLHQPVLAEFLRDPRLNTLLELVGADARLGIEEKDGLVINHYVNVDGSKFTQMGWHTDSVRDLFLGRKIMPMLNVGIHLDDQAPENGGLRVLPGSHRQKLGGMLFRKRYFVDNTPDPKEVGFAINAGDLTIHDGRIWHRVERSHLVGEASRRRVMYVPIICGKFQPRTGSERTPIYHRLQHLVK